MLHIIIREKDFVVLNKFFDEIYHNSIDKLEKYSQDLSNKGIKFKSYSGYNQVQRQIDKKTADKYFKDFNYKKIAMIAGAIILLIIIMKEK